MKAFRKVEVSVGIAGELLLHSMPGRYENWGEFIKMVGSAKVDLIACLTPLPEIKTKSPEYEQAIGAAALPCSMEAFAVPDYQAPSDKEGFASFIRGVARHIEKGGRVLLHCAGGVGRTGMSAMCVLQELGVPFAEALKAVEAAGSTPDTKPQMEFAVNWELRTLG